VVTRARCGKPGFPGRVSLSGGRRHVADVKLGGRNITTEGWEPIDRGSFEKKS